MSSKDLLEKIGVGRPLVSDGAIGSMLIAGGLRAGMCPETFNLEKPHVLEEIARAYMEAGADIVDVGGESTRPGSDGVDEAEEKRRVLPVIEQLSRATDAVISVDTVKPGVARAALDAGATMVNDVSNLRDGPGLAEVAAEGDAHLVLMHSRGRPADMQQMTDYRDVVADVIDALRLAVATAKRAGVREEKIWIDPGIGFAKTVEQNLELLRRLDEIVALGYPVLVGPSRKSFIGKISDADVSDRLGGTVAATTAAIMNGASAVRVHDVAVARQAALVACAIAGNSSSSCHLKEAADA